MGAGVGVIAMRNPIASGKIERIILAPDEPTLPRAVIRDPADGWRPVFLCVRKRQRIFVINTENQLHHGPI